MKTAIFASIIASAAAFAPTQHKESSTKLNAFEDELGVQVRFRFGVFLNRATSLSVSVWILSIEYLGIRDHWLLATISLRW